MAVIEVMSFRLAPGVEEHAFFEADQQAQAEFFYTRPGLMRRTTARNVDGEWIVVTLWASPDDAGAGDGASGRDSAFTRWTALREASTIVTRRYQTFD